MNGKLRENFESMLKKGDYAQAESLLKEYVELDPDDRDAKMLYGTCRMLQGDTRTAKRIHDELEPYFSANPDLPEPKRSFWQKYHRWILYGTAAALVIGGAGYAALCKLAESVAYSMVPVGSSVAATYAGPPITYYCRECGNPTSIGWGWIKDARYKAELQKKVDNGLIPCQTCGKDTSYTRDKSLIDSEKAFKSRNRNGSVRKTGGKNR